jgi:hypothetical protein
MLSSRFFFTLAIGLFTSFGSGATTVYPTGTSPTDAAAVQAAVNSGGTVVLKAVNAAGIPTAFNFGASDEVDITTDVAIVGETSKSSMTTIEGGRAAIHSRGNQFPFPKIEVRGIHFDNQQVAIVISSASGALITENVITNFVFAAVLIQNVPNPSAIVGVVNISDNVIDTGLDPFADGIAVLAASATVEVTGNDVRNVADIGIVGLVVGPLSISGNLVAPGFVTDLNFGTGILVFPEFASDDPVLIDRNVISCTDPGADGVDVFAGRPTTITHNQVSMQSTNIGIGLIGNASAAYVGQNRVAGAVGAALTVLDNGQGDAVGNALVGNNLSGAHAELADLFLDQNTRDSIVTGSGGATVLDLGTNNHITGVGSIGHANIGQGIKNALATKRAVIDALRSRYQ